MRRGAPHVGAADLAKLRELREAARESGRELTARGMTLADIAEVFRLSERAVREILSDARALSMATMRELAGWKRHA